MRSTSTLTSTITMSAANTKTSHVFQSYIRVQCKACKGRGIIETLVESLKDCPREECGAVASCRESFGTYEVFCVGASFRDTTGRMHSHEPQQTYRELSCNKCHQESKIWDAPPNKCWCGWTSDNEDAGYKGKKIKVGRSKNA